MDSVVQEFISGIKVGARQSHRNMTLYCLLTANEVDADFLTLDEALAEEVLTIRELDESGSVPELKVTNKSSHKVLLLDGEELVGAKQNRVLNVTILIAPESETVVPVSCVEEGRWSCTDKHFKSELRHMSADLRKKKGLSVHRNLTALGSFASAQAMVWEEIDDKFARMKAPRSSTGALSDLYKSKLTETEDFLKAFPPVENQIGMLVFIDGETAGLELLGGFEPFKKAHAKLVTSYIMDALETVDAKSYKRASVFKAAASRVLRSAANAPVERRKSVALGSDLRLRSDEVVGAGLEYEGRILHLSVFSKDG